MLLSTAGRGIGDLLYQLLSITDRGIYDLGNAIHCWWNIDDLLQKKTIAL